MKLEVLSFGAVVRCLFAPDRNGRLVDVVLGYDDLSSYESDRSYMGAAIGRYANRIRDGIFTLDGSEYHLSRNEGLHHLHGGERGFDKVVWRSSPFEDSGTIGVVLEHTSPHGDEGYPGELVVQLTYSLSPANEFSVEYHATADRATPVNLTNHGYFNLSGEGNGDVLDHELKIYADRFAEIDSDLLPTGNLLSVEGTPFDFRQSEAVGARIADDHEQLRRAGGYDHNFVLGDGDSALARAARVFDPLSGVEMEVLTTEPGMQFYSGNFLNPDRPGKGGNVYQRRGGFCLETQHFPDSPNHPEFPSTILRPGEEYKSRTEYRFSSR
jgi:aldose 1-epimerase